MLNTPGGEFNNKGYSPAQRVFVAYRAILSREPDQGGFDFYVGCLTSGTCTWTQVIDGLYDSPEFSGLVPSICAGGNYRDDMGANRPIPIGGERSQATLQRELDAGGTVCLNPQEVVYLTSRLVIPGNATLATCSVTDPTHTAKFGRLVRDFAFSTEELVVTSGTVDRVWIDGQRGRFGQGPPVTSNMVVDGGTVTNSRVAEPMGLTNIHAPETCGASPVITNNLVTGYTTLHSGGGWSDGLSIACNGTYVADNGVIDATDVGIVLFAVGANAGQNIIIERNTVVAAGRSAFAAFVLCDAQDFFDTPCTGSFVRNNSLWTSPSQHFDIGLSVGTYAWNPGTAIGGSATNNSTPTGLNIRVNNGIVVDAVLNVSVLSNLFSAVAIQTNGCPLDAGVSADIGGQHASGSIQDPKTDRAVHGCVSIGH